MSIQYIVNTYYKNLTLPVVVETKKAAMVAFVKNLLTFSDLKGGLVQIVGQDKDLALPSLIGSINNKTVVSLHVPHAVKVESFENGQLLERPEISLPIIDERSSATETALKLNQLFSSSYYQHLNRKDRSKHSVQAILSSLDGLDHITQKYGKPVSKSELNDTDIEKLISLIDSMPLVLRVAE